MAREMKDSGIKWIGEIPREWKLVKMKYLGKCRNGLTYSPDNIVSEMGTLVLRSSNIKNGKLDFKDTVYVDCEINQELMVSAGDILICSRNGSKELIGKNALIPENLTASFGAFMMIFRCNSPKYIQMILNSSIFSYYLGTFLTSTINQLTADNFNNMKIVYCDDEIEQQKIADYLDNKCSKIDEITAKIKTTIDEYKKLKQSVITEAVTKGIRPDREMKDSGVEWIGEIPKEWEIYPLKYIIDYNAQVLNESTNPDFEFEYIDIGSVIYGEGITSYQKMKFNNSPSRARRVVNENDIIISTVRTYLKAIAKISKHDIPQIVSTGFITMTANEEKIISDFLYYSVLSHTFISKVESNSIGISYPAINANQIVCFKILVPSKNEQQEIAEYLEKKCAEIDAVIAKKEQLVNELENYKKSLIYEYVTGKKEVI